MTHHYTISHIIEKCTTVKITSSGASFFGHNLKTFGSNDVKLSGHFANTYEVITLQFKAFNLSESNSTSGCILYLFFTFWRITY